MQKPDVDAMIDEVNAEVSTEGVNMEGLSNESLRAAMEHPKAREVIAEMMKREQASVQAGDPAPDFCLPRLEPERQGEQIRLSDHAGSRPVALIFGSYT